VQDCARGVACVPRLALSLPGIAAMSENEAAAPARPRITPAARQRWLEAAQEFLQGGETTQAVDAFLQREGCPPRLRHELLRQAHARSLGPHRAQGLRVLAMGVGVAILGSAILWWARTTFVVSQSGVVGHPARLSFCGVVVIVVGAWMALVGAWKILTGSRIDITAEIE
jgi:hypothetical protein